MSIPTGGWGFIWEIGRWPTGVWLGVLYLAIVNTGLSHLLFVYALRDVTSAQAVSYTYLQPAMTALMAVFALDEHPGIMTLVCGVVILLGLWLVNRPQAGRPRRVPPDPAEPALVGTRSVKP
jgi:drug/metabolite transporter (DMT)-like permease